MYRLLIAAVLFIAIAIPVRAQEWTRTYGGRGEDQLTELIPVGDGLLAVGRTFSSDGDLSKRTRSGETGWAIRLDAQGEPLWSLSTAHVSRATMSHPFLHADGTFSCVLSGDGAGFEWLRIDDGGQIIGRIEFPRDAALCSHDDHATMRDVFPYEIDGMPMLAVQSMHSDGTVCFAAMDEAGNITQGATVYAGEIAHVCQRANGGVVLLGIKNGASCVTWIVPGNQEMPFSIVLEQDRAPVSQLFDAFASEDGSVIFSGQLTDGDGFLERVSANGERIFFLRTAAANHIVPTDSGFAAFIGTEWMFYDEEGELLGLLRGDWLHDAQLTDAAPLSKGVAMLQYLPDSVRKQARVTVAEGFIDAEEVLYADALYACADSRLLAAQAVPEGALMLIENESGETVCLLVLPNGEAHEDERMLPAHLFSVQGEQALSEGTVRWQEEPGGALVTRIGAGGTVLWQTRTPIHTVADRLQWRCAAETTDGGVLLGGNYVTEEGNQTSREAIIATLGEDGVLRDYSMLDGETVCAILVEEEDVNIVLAREGMAFAVISLKTNREITLTLPIEEEHVALLRAPNGALWIAGTAERGGRFAAVLQVVH